MADIHVLTGARIGRSSRKVLKSYAFHFPIPPGDQVANAALDPELVAFVSLVPDIEQTELDDIKAGRIVEVWVEMPYNRDISDADAATKVRAEYNGMENEVRIEYIEKYRQYLVTLTA